MSDAPEEVVEQGSMIHQAAYHGEALAREIDKLIEDPARRIVPMNRRTLDEIRGALRSLSGAVKILDEELRKSMESIHKEANKKED
jgi:hypothetical protein